MKKIIMVVALVLCLGITVHASSMPVTLPYVPPMEVQVYDALFNASGVTAPNEMDDEKRLEAYIDLFRLVMGASADSFIDIMKSVTENAKTNSEIVMDGQTASAFQQAVKYALQNGVRIPNRSDEFPTYEVFKTYYQQNVAGNTYPTQGFYERFKEYTMEHPTWKIMLGYNAGAYYPHAIISQNQGWTGNTTFVYYSPCLILYGTGYNYITHDGWTETWNIYRDTTQTFNNLSEFIARVNVSYQVKQVIAKDTATQQAISAGKNAILTADSALTESDLLDTTKPVVINIYRNITYPATTQEDIEEKQRELVVTNIATDEVAITQKETLEDIRTETYGDTETYKLDLLSFFPFCIPKDIMLLLQAFVAEPQTPEFDIPFPTWENGQMTTMNYTISLAQFESLAAALRTFECIVFMIGLLVVTRQKYLRG